MKVEEAYQKGRCTSVGLASHKRRKVMSDSKVCAVNDLDENDDDDA
jgi:hypothetical protein